MTLLELETQIVEDVRHHISLDWGVSVLAKGCEPVLLTSPTHQWIDETKARRNSREFLCNPGRP